MSGNLIALIVVLWGILSLPLAVLVGRSLRETSPRTRLDLVPAVTIQEQLSA